jgi:hypothetical protein
MRVEQDFRSAVMLLKKSGLATEVNSGYTDFGIPIERG